MFKKKLTHIKTAIENYILAKIVYLLSVHHSQKIESLRNKPNVFIHEKFTIGTDSHIRIEGDCKKIEIDENVYGRNFCNFLIYPNATLIIKKNVFFNNYCSINCLGQIEIGENTLFGEGVKLYDHNHEYKRQPYESQFVERDKYTIGKIKIGDNCWIGSSVTILNNVEIGDNVIIGANNLIYKSIPSNTIIKAKAEYLTINNNI